MPTQNGQWQKVQHHKDHWNSHQGFPKSPGKNKQHREEQNPKKFDKSRKPNEKYGLGYFAILQRYESK